MNTLFTLRGLGHRGRVLAHQLSLERPPRPAHASAGIELTVVDLADPRVELALLASTVVSDDAIQRRVALVLAPRAFDLASAPPALHVVREQFDAWIPVLPFEVTHPHQDPELGLRSGYLPSLRTIFWRLARMLQHPGIVDFDDDDFEELWTNGTTLWSFSATASGPTRAELAAQLLEASGAEPLLWNATSRRWMMQITASALGDDQLQMEEIVALTEPFSAEPFQLEGIRWAISYDDDLADRLVVDVLAVGEPIAQAASAETALVGAHRMS